MKGKKKLQTLMFREHFGEMLLFSFLDVFK